VGVWPRPYIWRICDNGSMVIRADDERCKHDQVAAWCGESECLAGRTGLPVRVWRTARGAAYHRVRDCAALIDGQRLAGRSGQEMHAPEQVPLADAMSAGLGECYHCFPENVPPDAKRCQVRLGGQWVDGFLLKWQRREDGQWQGLVNYREGHGRRTRWLNEDHLRPDSRDTGRDSPPRSG
jgi:hypothetical protein